MKIFVKDVERTPDSVYNSTANNGRSISNPYSFSPRIKSKHVQWIRPVPETYSALGKLDIPDDINTVLWTDRSPLFYTGFNTSVWSLHEYMLNPSLYDFNKPFPKKRNVQIIMEPPAGCGEIYNIPVTQPAYRNKFDVILTHNLELCSKHEKFKWYPWGTSLLDNEDEFQIYPKDKLVSYVYSFKAWWEGHKFRHQVGETLRANDKFKFVDILGPLGIKDYVSKISTLKRYHYSVQIENQKVDDFFSDKIIDSFLTGTIPIYRGTNNIGKYFDKRGIITFDEESELLEILANLTPDYYYKNIEAITHNFNEAKKYISPDDWIYLNYGNEVFI